MRKLTGSITAGVDMVAHPYLSHLNLGNLWRRISSAALQSLCALSGALILLSGAPAQAATLTVENGELIGATDVDVNGTLFDVVFLDGSCASLFNGCNDPAEFDFTTRDGAGAAANALLTQVFIDGPDGQFDSDFRATRGCGGAALSCIFVIPWDRSNDIFPGAVLRAGAVNAAQEQDDQVLFSTASRLLDTGQIHGLTSAVFTPSASAVSEVPVPAALPLFLAGAAGIGAVTRRRRERAA